MTQIIDKRYNAKNKSAVNRQKFLKRYKSQIKKAVSEAVAGRSITDMEKGETISIPTKDISEPVFKHGNGGNREIIHPGNKEFVAGDKVPRPQQQGGGKGNKASNKGEGLDDFVFQLSKEEFMEFFFEDLELPNLVKTKLASITEYKKVRAGYKSDGVPSNINIVRSFRGALARRIAIQSPHRAQLKELQEQIDSGDIVDEEENKLLLEKIQHLKSKINSVPFIDPFDLKYNNLINEPKPTTQAVMFCIMDISGSMDQSKKDIAKRFFILLYMFLTRTYEKIQIVFISHHTIAKEVDEENFFYSRETGGTVVSSAIKLLHKVIQEKFPTSDWNIYAAQASDGDNWNDDSPYCSELLINSVLPCLQYYAYIEITHDNPQNLWREYLKVKSKCENFAMQRIESVSDIYPVFRELFQKQLS